MMRVKFCACYQISSNFLTLNGEFNRRKVAFNNNCKIQLHDMCNRFKYKQSVSLLENSLIKFS